jgi:YD repeat-containing protein
MVLYDANGNVGQLVENTTGHPLTAHYEYDPYGNTIAATGPYAAANPWRFSTKWHDTELPGNVLSTTDTELLPHGWDMVELGSD